MEEKKIMELFITKYDNGDKYGIENIYIKYSNGYPSIETYSEELHGEATVSFLSELTGIKIDSKEALREAMAKASEEHSYIFGVYKRPVDNKTIEELEARFAKDHEEWIEKNPMPIAVETPVVGKDDPIEDNKDKNNKILKRVAWGAVGAGLLVGGLVLLNKCSQDEDVKEEGQEAIKLTQAQKEFFDKSAKFANDFNGLTAKQGNFKLEADKDVELKMSFAEAIALNVSINDYSAEEIYELFGVLGLDAENLTALRNSAYEKLTTYYMNATELSGVADMIRDEDAKAFYLSQEQAIVAFNENPSQELADNFINTTMDNYLNVKNGDSVEMKESLVVGEGSSAMAKAGYMASTTVQGYMMANRNVDEYLRESETGLQITSLKTEKDGVATRVGVIDIINDANLCNDLNESIEQLVSDYNEKVSTLETYEQTMLLSSLSEKGADLVREKGFGQDTLQEVAGLSVGDSKAVNNYLDNMEAYETKGVLIQNYISESNAKVGDTKQTDVAFLINNRFRTPLEKENVVTPNEDKKPAVEEEKETTTKEEKVEYEDLTKEEKEEVDKQVEELKKKEYEGNATAEGEKDASKYATTKGEYTYVGGRLYDANGTDVTSEVSDTDLYNIAYTVAAYSDKEITVEDKAIQEARSEDVAEFRAQLEKEGYSDIDTLVSRYSSAWNETMDDLLETATKEGNEEESRVAKELEELKKLLEEANKEFENGNQTKGEEVMGKAEEEFPVIYEDKTTTPPVVEDVTPSDPEMDEDYNAGGIPFDYSAYFQSSELATDLEAGNQYTK